MESGRSSKKTRSHGYGGAPKGSRNSQSSPTRITEGRPQYKERLKLAPLGVPQAIEQQQRQRRSQQPSTEKFRRQSQSSHSSRGSPSLPSSPGKNQHFALPQRDSDFGRPYRFHDGTDAKPGGSDEMQEVTIAVLGASASLGKITSEVPQPNGFEPRQYLQSTSGVPPETRLCLGDSDEEIASAGKDAEVRGAGTPSKDSEIPLRLHPSDSSNPFGIVAGPDQFDIQDRDEHTFDTESLEQMEIKTPATEDDRTQELGSSLEELVDRLLSRPMSKADSKFAAIFLCLYRKFAAPYALITAILRHFEDLNGKDIPYLTRITSQLRYLNILKDWISDYPGDFAHPLTRRTMAGFVQSLEASQEYAVASKEINPYLDVVSEDDDTEWGCSDRSRSRANTMESFLTMSSAHSTASTLNADSPTLTADSSTEDIVDNANIEKIATYHPQRISATPSSTSSISRSDSKSIGSFQTPLSTVEKAKCQAQALAPMSRNMLTKVQWHQFMEIPEDQIARELTRLDWIMFCAIRPRDLIRHRIPFLPLHRRDLVLAEQGNPTYILDEDVERINWKKFEIMGDVIIGIRKSQEVPYPNISRNEEIQRLVLDGQFCKDDDRLYERSIQLEAPGAGEMNRKRFNWFQR
ncbi:hypothetical protein P7C71_g3849, partial [Lecanoromycetidae sp. Uapishka_2]